MSKPVDLEKLRSISVSASATPSRNPNVAARTQDNRQLAKDAAAYRRLRKDGTQPRQVDGCAELEKKAESKFQVETSRHFRTPDAGL